MTAPYLRGISLISKTLVLLVGAAAIILNPTDALSMRPSSSVKPIPNVRIELFFRNTSELRERVQLLSSKGVKAFNLVNKSNKDDLRHWAEVIREEVSDSDVCLHYSLKYNKCRKKDGAFLLLEDFVKDMNADSDKNTNDGAKNEILLISGSGPKGKLNSVTALERLANSNKIEIEPTAATHALMAAAFNPFLPSKEDLELEKHRLMKKIGTGQVQKIYLQFGTDLEQLRSSLQWLTNLKKNHDNLAICGSIFLPTKKLIAQQKFRPWNGVFLSEEFLNSEDGAKGIVLYMMRLYEEFDCEILFEAPGVRNEKDMNIVEQLLAERGAILSKDPQSVLRDSSSTIEVDANNNSFSKRRRIDQLARVSPKVSNELLKKPAIVLFGSHDVRVHDNIALQLASYHSAVIPLFIWSQKEQGQWGVNGAAEVVLKSALQGLSKKLSDHGLRLICRSTNDSTDELGIMCREIGASVVYLNKEHTTESRAREQLYKNALNSQSVTLIECQSSLLYDPMTLSLASGFNGGHWGTLMPFLKACKRQCGEPRRPMKRFETLSMLEAIKGPESWPLSTPIEELDLAIIKGENKWDIPIRARFPMGEDDALKNMNLFFQEGFHKYEKERSRADIDWSTSKLSAHLRIGTLSPNELYYKVEDTDLDYEDKKTFSRRLFWRDLAYFHLLNFPKMREHSIRTHYDNTEWVTGAEEKRRFQAWKTGNTGYPLVDAGMRELYATGWMTQSVRMVVASFLTEYLRVNWVKGCEWFHYTLVDADSAINPMMWQNAGRSGIDQWNFVMSPVAGSQDGTGSYTKKWVAELSKLSKPLLHKPWDAHESVLRDAGIILGETYPHRIVTDLKLEREISDACVLAMRRSHQEFNNDRGYDLIEVQGKQTVVFTKKTFRIDRKGNIMKGGGSKKKSKAGENKRCVPGRRNKTQEIC